MFKYRNSTRKLDRLYLNYMSIITNNFFSLLYGLAHSLLFLNWYSLLYSNFIHTAVRLEQAKQNALIQQINSWHKDWIAAIHLKFRAHFKHYKKCNSPFLKAVTD